MPRAETLVRRRGAIGTPVRPLENIPVAGRAEVFLDGDKLFYHPVGEEKAEGVLLFSN